MVFPKVSTIVRDQYEYRRHTIIEDRDIARAP